MEPFFVQTCPGSDERWPGGRCLACTRHLGSRRLPHPDWPPAERPLRWTSPPSRSRLCLRSIRRPRPSGRCLRGTPAHPNPPPGTDLKENRGSKTQIQSEINLNKTLLSCTCDLHSFLVGTWVSSTGHHHSDRRAVLPPHGGVGGQFTAHGVHDHFIEVALQQRQQNLKQ